MKNVTVLLSSYNGEKYISDQIKSIYAQKEVNVSLIVRDDGSNDNTIKLLRMLGKKLNFKWYSGDNIGAAFSFQELLFDCNLDSDYYAFSDQDDIWKEEKLIKGINKMIRFEDVPCLYYSNYEIVDNQLNNLKSVKLKLYTLGNTILGQAPLGCTMILNKKMIEIVRKKKSEKMRMHDHWCLLTCLAYDGKVIYGHEKTLLYRQHSNNVVGGNPNINTKIKRYYRSFFYGNNERLQQILEFKKIHGSYLSQNNINIINLICSYKECLINKIRVIFNRQLKTGSFFKDIIFIISIIFNRF
ncbi:MULTISPECIES: glycosyltransferase [Thomasclavelia]|uniref:glycosyltransferase n=1 Tax=Thomasclavelia TaxID=3025755 RepID=UPI00320AB72B